MEEVIHFKNEKSNKLYGIVHIPSEIDIKKERVGINLLNPGLKYRVAPNRLSVKIARQLCHDGYYVFRFDPEGIGDSEGELPPNKDKIELWGRIQRGLFVKDTKISNDFFIHTYNINKLILIGNCGGAITSILSTEVDPRIECLILIDVPIILLGSDYSFADRVVSNNEKIDYLFYSYIKNIFRFSSWKNLLSGKTEMKSLMKILKLKFGGTVNHGSRIEQDGVDKSSDNGNINQSFFRAFESFMNKKKKILFVTAGKDPGTDIFNRHVANRYLLTDSKYTDLVETTCIKNANHIYSEYEWQTELIEKIRDFLRYY